MSEKDFLKNIFSELPTEKAPKNFTHRVMHEVMNDWSLNPTKYKPVISTKVWWGIGLLTVAFVLILFIIQNSLGETSQSTIDFSFLSKVNFSSALSPISQLFEKITTLPPAIGIGSLAIIALWFFDQIFTKLARN
jgi:hypothetical protein